MPMLILKSKTNDHDMRIEEYTNPGGSGVVGLDLSCETCKTNDSFDMLQYPKYRLAMAAAYVAAAQHAGVDAVVFSL